MDRVSSIPGAWRPALLLVCWFALVPPLTAQPCLTPYAVPYPTVTPMQRATDTPLPPGSTQAPPPTRVSPPPSNQVPPPPVTPTTPPAVTAPSPSGPTAAPPPDTTTPSGQQSFDDDYGPSTRDSTVGYIDSAIPGNVLRLRVDAAYGDNEPSRGAFFYARSPSAPGNRVETNVDYQEIAAYGEYALDRTFSLFAEVPFRFLNPTVDANAKGLGDSNFGFRWAFLYEKDLVATFQFRTYVPTGNGDLGLGTSHVSLEPALLGYYRLADRWSVEGEFRVFVPVGDSPTVNGSVNGGAANFYSDVIRYGIGVHYDLFKTPGLVISPVTEVVGWTFLNGKQTVPFPDGNGADISAAGDTIVNVKVGARFKIPDVGDVYVGYGRALTGDVLYKDIIRAEVRFLF
jgi:hypothetical protein